MNLPIVNIERFTKIVELNFREGINRPIFGLGKGGIGKSESIYELSKKLGVGYIDIRLLLYSEVDLKGIPYPDANHIKTIWLQNNILPTVEKDGERGILVLDEITSVARSVRTAAYQLLNERKLGEYVLPDGWMIVCLGNGEEDGGDFQGMEGNFANRCSIYQIEPNIEAFKVWAISHGVNPLVTAYISWQKAHLHTYNPEDNEMLFASPRSWAAVSDILNRTDYNPNTDDLTNIRINANVGTLVGNQFIAFCKYKDSGIATEDILEGKPIKEIQNLEVMHITIQSLIKLMADMVKEEFHNKASLTATTLTKCANGCNWILKLSRLEHQAMGIKDFIKSDPDNVRKLLLSKEFDSYCPGFFEFTKKNAAIFR